MTDDQRLDNFVERLQRIGRAPKLHSAHDLIQRFAKIVKEYEADGIFRMEGKDGMEMARVCQACRKYLELCGIRALPRFKLPSEFVFAFADLIDDPTAADKIDRLDVGPGGEGRFWLARIVQAMRGYARKWLTFDILRNRRVMASVKRGGAFEVTL